MEEEITLDVKIETLLGVYSDPNRDPRFHVVSLVYVCKSDCMPIAADDAKTAEVIPLSSIGSLNLAFDHEKILADYLCWYKENRSV